jgi:hypothetical protein
MCDNQAALFALKEGAVSDRSKHIDLKYHYVRDLHAKGSVKFKYVRSEDNAADILTKPLGKEPFHRGAQSLRVLPVADPTERSVTIGSTWTAQASLPNKEV